MAMAKLKNPTFKDGRTKQSFRDETDINKLLQRAQKSGTISHLNKHQGHYVDFADFDFSEANFKLAAGRQIFDELPSEIRNEFQNPAAFFKYVNDPENKDRLGELLPALAAPGKQFVQVDGNIKADEAKALEASEKPPEVASEGKPPEKVEKAPEEPSSGST